MASILLDFPAIPVGYHTSPPLPFPLSLWYHTIPTVFLSFREAPQLSYPHTSQGAMYITVTIITGMLNTELGQNCTEGLACILDVLMPLWC